MNPSDVRDQIRRRLRSSVGGFFTNTLRGAPGTCRVCTGPARAALCTRCRDHRAEFGDRLADLVVPLAYVRAGMRPTHQSEHHMYAYKGSPPVPKCAKDLALMILGATVLHGNCIAATGGGRPTAVTFVPSARAQGPAHPAAQLARQVVDHGHGLRPVGLALGASGTNTDRAVLEDRFVVQARWRERVEGQHVVLVDDAWISGAKAQSAAIALRAAGARWVTVLCVGRWLRYDWSDHREFIAKLDAPYEPSICPVVGGTCT